MRGRVLGTGKQPSKRRTKRGDAGARSRNFSRFTAWKVDQDYLAKLTPKERRWLAHFNDCHYGGDFRGAGAEWSVAQRRESWNGHWAERGDLQTHAGLQGALEQHEDGTEHGEPASLTPTPEYLNSPEYKAARDAFRAELQPGRRARAPVDTKKYRRAARRLAVLTPDPPEDE